MQSHLNYKDKKIKFITNKLTPVRLRDSPALNVNLFRIMVLPLYRFGYTYFPQLKTAKKDKFVRHINKNFW